MAPVRGDGLRPGQGPDRGHLRGPSGLPVRRPEHGGPSVSADGLPPLRRLLLEARERHLPPGPPGDLRRPGPHAARLGQPHTPLRGARHAGDRRRRPRRRVRDGRERLLPALAPGGAGRADRPPPAVGRREGRDPRAPPPAHGPRRVRQDLRVRGAGRREPDRPPAGDHREHGSGARTDHVGVPLRRRHAELPRAPGSRRDVAAARRRPRGRLRRLDRDRPLGDRAARRAPRLPGPGRAGRRGRGHADRAGPGGVLHQRLVGGHVRRRRRLAGPPRPRRRVLRALSRQPADPGDDGTRGPGRRPDRGRRGHLRVDLRRLSRDRARPGDGIQEPARVQPELPGAERRQGRSDLSVVDPDGVRVRAPRADHRSAASSASRP